MRIFVRVSFLIFLVLMSCSKNSKKSESEVLQAIITEMEERNSYDDDKYPLGLFSKEHFEKEATYAKEQLEKLKILR